MHMAISLKQLAEDLYICIVIISNQTVVIEDITYAKGF